MASGNPILIDSGFWLALQELETYNIEDIENYKKIINIFNESHPIISPYIGNDIECSKCNGKVTNHKKRCKICGCDSRGFNRESFLYDEYKTSDELVEVLLNRIDIIKQAFEI